VILRTLSLLIAPFVVLFALLAILTIGKANLGAGHPASLAVVMIALALAISSTGLGWTMSGSDYSRYLHPRTSRARIVWSVALGGAIPSVLLMLLGAAVATAVTSATDPISGLPQAFPSWFLVPYLIFVIVQIYAINSLDLYSSSVTLQAIGLRLRRYQAVLIDTCICCVLTGAIIFSSSFYTYLTDFLLFMVIWFSPWVAIFLVDYVLRRGRYDARSLLDPRAGIYWRRGGVHVPGLVAQLLGMVASAMWIDTTVFKGPLSSATNGADLSIYMGIVVGGVVYYVLARHGVRDEAARTPSVEEADAQATAASVHAV
jgi:purine-cytosine permease-like protein